MAVAGHFNRQPNLRHRPDRLVLHADGLLKQAGISPRGGPTHCAQIVETRDGRGITDRGWRVM